MTSHDCVARLRRIIGLKRVGHGGTLDPAATGVLPIALGKATRLLQFLPSTKVYRATIRLGVSTTTDDLEGEIITSKPCSTLDLEQVKIALQMFQGTIAQVPPSYSAIQIAGRRLYELARAGETVEIPARRVEIFQIEVLAWRIGDFPELDLEITCGAGTYIRAIARDLGATLATGGTLADLTRIESGGFRLTDSLTLEQLQSSPIRPIPPGEALSHLPSVTLAATSADKWSQGQRLPFSGSECSSTPIRIYHENGQFLGMGRIINNEVGLLLIPEIVF